jgi:hypothetical protein
MELYPVWRNKIVKTNLQLFNTNVKFVLLYGCETWKIAKFVSNSLQMFVNWCQRNLNVKWLEKILNEKLLHKTKQTPTEWQMKERKWRWISHTLWKPHGTVERTLDWNPQGTRKRGRPRTTWKKHHRMGNAEGWKKLERDKRTSLR